MLAKYLCCKERFRLLVIEGLRPVRSWDHKTGYGDMWHVCEEAMAKISGGYKGIHEAHVEPLREYVQELLRRYPTQRDEIRKWYMVCATQFPIYTRYWSSHPHVATRTPVYQEQVFAEQYGLPSGRSVLLRGKWDSYDLVKLRGSTTGWLQENKTKGDVNETQLRRQLTFDLQTMVYLTALQCNLGWDDAGHRVAGVRYNVVRRPLSGGKGSIKRREPSKSNPVGETENEFYQRLAGYITEEPHTYFMRLEVNVTRDDLDVFRRTCLDPVLENLLDDYEWWDHCKKKKLDPFDAQPRNGLFPQHCPRHFRFPFGVRNALTEGGQHDLDEFLATGSRLGLEQATNLFPELT